MHLEGGQTIQNLLRLAIGRTCPAFLQPIDGRTNIFESAGDGFKNPFKNM